LLTAKRPDHGRGGTSQVELLQELVAPTESAQDIELDYQRELFRYAAARVKLQVHDVTWQAFWSVAVQEKKPSEVADELRMTVGAVYIARSRVIARLRKEVQRLEAENAPA
ncbi:MAG: hypothetical protein KDA51_13620, partial [Planctomycetales bacterium]|nr:hypothetical protein [Planctomycetales bacterium]